MEESQQISSLQAQHPSKRPYYTASRSNPPPCYFHLLSFLLQAFHSWASPLSPQPHLFQLALLQSGYLFKSYQIHTCGLQPAPKYLYNRDLQNNPSKSFTLHPPISILYSTANLHLYSFCFTHLLPTISYFHSHPHSSSFQTIHLLLLWFSTSLFFSKFPYMMHTNPSVAAGGNFFFLFINLFTYHSQFHLHFWLNLLFLSFQREAYLYRVRGDLILNHHQTKNW